MRLAALGVAMLSLAACERRDPATPPGSPPPSSAALLAAPVGAARATAGPRGVETPFAGRWAARPDLCDDGAWVVTPTGVTTAGEVSCRFDGPVRGTGPWTAPATCHAEGSTSRETLRITRSPATGSLRIDGGPFAPIGLGRCDASAAG